VDIKKIKVGDTFTTQQSKVTGEVKEVVKNASGSVRIRLLTPKGERWTTAMQDADVWA
jgi:hypothetical protein